LAPATGAADVFESAVLVDTAGGLGEADFGLVWEKAAPELSTLSASAVVRIRFMRCFSNSGEFRGEDATVEVNIRQPSRRRANKFSIARLTNESKFNAVP
jgi:hypothetical protein